MLITLLKGPINEDTQLSIEKYLMDKHLDNYLNKDNSNIDLNFDSITNDLFQLLLENKPLLIKLIEHYRTDINDSDKLEDKILLKCDNDYLLNILYGRLLRIVSQNGRANKNTYTTEVCIDLGKDIVNKYIYYLKMEDTSHKSKLFEWKNKPENKFLSSLPKNSTLCFHVGSKLISWLKELDLIDTKVEILSRIEKHSFLTSGDKLVNVLPPQGAENVPYLNLPHKIPMIVPPKLYKKLSRDNNQIQLGGYLLNDIVYTDDIFIDNWELKQKTTVLSQNIIYSLVNNINSVPFSINQKVLEFILLNYSKYDLIIDPDFIHPLSLKSRLTTTQKKELESFYSKKDLEQNILGLAYIFNQVDKFYLPVRLDYRGRLYCISEYLNYQGIELAKALLQFANGEKVDKSDEKSIQYFKIYGANCFGNKMDKCSFDERINWVDNHTDDIINFENGKLLSKADNKLLFIAFCYEYQNYLNSLKDSNTYFITHLPIQFDASCNGFQHLTLLIRDSNLAEQLNLSSSKFSDRPKDFYNFIALKLNHFFINEVKNNKDLSLENKESYERLVNLNIERDLVKKPLMTKPYNVSPISMIEYLKENFLKKDNKYIKLNNPDIILFEKDFHNLRKALDLVLNLDLPNLKKLVEYFKIVARICNRLGLQIPWILPSGLFVQQRYYATTKFKVKPFIYTKDLLTLNIPDKFRFNDRKQIRAFMPNLVHSLDAASLALLVDLFFKDKNKNFYSIHDCFAVTCNNINQINKLLKLTYYNIYTKESYLIQLDTGILNNIIKHLGLDCYDPKTKLITYQDQDKIIKIQYPDISNLISNDILNIEESSFLIH